MLEYRVKIAAVALLCAAFGAQALTLGRVRGAALMGRPLDLVVPLQIGAGEDASALCFEADVFHADARQDPARVRALVEAAGQPHTARVRILSSVPVDEPVVTIHLRAACGQQTSRRYVVLADFPSELTATPLPPPLVRLAPAAPSSVALKALPSLAPAIATVVPAPHPAARRPARVKRAETKTAMAAPRRAMADKKGKADPLLDPSRLKLDPLALFSQRVANLESAKAAARAEDALREAQKMQGLEADVKALRALATRSQASLLDMKGRLQKAQAQRFPKGLIYGLVALMLAALAGVALLWQRQRHAPPDGDDWWSGSLATPETTPEPVPPASEPEPEPKPAVRPVAAREQPGPATAAAGVRTVALTGAASARAPSSAVDVNLVEMSESFFTELAGSGSGAARAAFGPSPTSPARAPQPGQGHDLSSEAIRDVRQQAEFFVSLGQTDQAVQILRSQITARQEPNPFVYLDLLGIFQSLSLKAQFQKLREEFNRLFNGRVPEFSYFTDEGQGLEAYPDVLTRISGVWASAKVLEVIESFIFHDSRLIQRRSFDLAAFRDLLLLHAIARSVLVRPPPQRADAPAAAPPVTDLDLDLSDRMGPATYPVLPTDIDLPLLPPDGLPVERPGRAAQATLGIDNLIDFTLPDPAPPERSNRR